MNRASETGSALTLILIAVILFGALSYTVANMMRSGNSDTIGEQQAGLYADEILSYGRTLRQAVQNLKISNGCDNEDISFENAVVAGYTNGANTNCQVFHGNGAGMAYIAPSSDFGAGSEWVFGGRLNIVGVGSDCTSGSSCTELYVALENVKLTVCRAINERLGITTPSGDPPQQDDAVSFAKFTGSYTYQEDIEDATNDNVLVGRPAACSETSAGGSYFFYQTLVAR